MASITESGPTLGAQRALAWVRASEYRTIPRFCEAKSLDRLKFQKAVRGDISRIDVGFAFAVQSATDGQVLAEWWALPVETPESAEAG